MFSRIDRQRLLLGTYIIFPEDQTEENIRDMADAGIDLIFAMEPKNRRILDLMDSLHMGCIKIDLFPHWWGGDGSNAGKMAKTFPIDRYEKDAAKLVDHPAIWGLDLGDEPSALDFEHYGKVVARLKELLPDHFLCLNLYPNYASVAENNADQTVNQLGTATYEEHIAQYAEKVPLPYLCYDSYIYSLQEKPLSRFFDNFRITADTCRAYGKDLWFIAQANGRQATDFTSENQLRFQAYSALCYGTSVLCWACWSNVWWSNNVLDKEGNKTEQYEKVKKVNAELKRFGVPYMRYRRTETHLLGFTKAELDNEPALTIKRTLDAGSVRDLHAARGGKLVVGQMVGRENPEEEAFVICNATDYLDRAPSETTVSFRADGRTVHLYGDEEPLALKRKADGTYSFKLKNCHGALITLK